MIRCVRVHDAYFPSTPQLGGLVFQAETGVLDELCELQFLSKLDMYFGKGPPFFHASTSPSVSHPWMDGSMGAQAQSSRWEDVPCSASGTEEHAANKSNGHFYPLAPLSHDIHFLGQITRNHRSDLAL